MQSIVVAFRLTFDVVLMTTITKSYYWCVWMWLQQYMLNFKLESTVFVLFPPPKVSKIKLKNKTVINRNPNPIDSKRSVIHTQIFHYTKEVRIYFHMYVWIGQFFFHFSSFISFQIEKYDQKMMTIQIYRHGTNQLCKHVPQIKETMFLKNQHLHIVR